MREHTAAERRRISELLRAAMMADEVPAAIRELRALGITVVRVQRLQLGSLADPGFGRWRDVSEEYGIKMEELTNEMDTCQ